MSPLAALITPAFFLYLLFPSPTAEESLYTYTHLPVIRYILYTP